jgi:alpha-galactosidase
VKPRLILIAFLVFSCTGKMTNENSAKVPIDINKLALKPPMGWNSWNCFGVDVNEQQVKENADYMAKNLKSFGWEYIVVDLGWYFPPEINTATFQMQKPPQSTDEFGRLIPDIKKFPSSSGGQGFKPLADYIHKLGLKFGIHIMRGIPWQSVQGKKPVKGTSFNASMISNPNDTCIWDNGMIGVNMNQPGAQEYYNSLVELYAQWEVDFIKADDMSSPYHKSEITGLSNAIKMSGRKIVLSLSPGAAPLEMASNLAENANLWRISADFWDMWSLLKNQFNLCRQWAPYIKPGHWPDADMLPLGKLRITGQDYVAQMMGLKNKDITNEFSRFTKNEQYTLMTLWCIFKSPLMIGGNMPENDDFTLSLETNESAIEVNQESINNREIYNKNGIICWVADKPGSDERYIAFFNTTESPVINQKLDPAIFSIPGKFKVYDIWAKSKMVVKRQPFLFDINAHCVKFFKIIP